MSRSILFLSTLFPPAVGGAETYARILVEGLLARGHDVLLVTDEFPGRRRVRHVVELSRYLERLKSPELARLEPPHRCGDPAPVAAAQGANRTQPGGGSARS